MFDPTPLPDEVRALLDRSNRLGSDPAVTNYGGGNTSAKVTVISPASGEPVELLYVKGSGGDLGTLTADGLAVLERDLARGLDRVYRGVEHEDDMVALFAYCGHGSGGATPSIDTPMHALVEYLHVDHLHPDSVIALACAADGEKLVDEIWGGAVAWVPWKRPGWELGRTMRELSAQEGVIGAVLGGHGLTAWGRPATRSRSGACGSSGKPLHTWRRSPSTSPGSVDSARASPPTTSAAVGPPPSSRTARVASRDSRQVGHFTDSDVVLDFSRARQGLRPGPPRDELPGPLPAHQGAAAAARHRAGRPARGCRRAAAHPRGGVPRRVPRLLRAARHATRPRRCAGRAGHRAGARRRDVLVLRTSRRPGWPASSTSTPSTSCAGPRASRPTPRSTRPTSSPWSTGSSRSRSSNGDRIQAARRPHRRRPARRPASASRPPGRSRPRGQRRHRRPGRGEGRRRRHRARRPGPRGWGRGRRDRRDRRRRRGGRGGAGLRRRPSRQQRGITRRLARRHRRSTTWSTGSRRPRSPSPRRPNPSCAPSRWAATSSTSARRTPCSPVRTTSRTRRPRPRRRTWSGCSRPSSATSACASTGPDDRQGFGHLRGWLGRVASQDLRCGGGGPGQVLRTADRAQGGGAAGARGLGGGRLDQRLAARDDRTRGTGGLGSARGLPAVGRRKRRPTRSGQ